MDAEIYRTAMQLLASLPSAHGVDPTHRYESYYDAFRGDSGPLFLAACKLGFQTRWHFFPTPPEIREQMVALEDAAHRSAVRELNEERVARAIEHDNAMVERRACQNDGCGLCRRDASLNGE